MSYQSVQIDPLNSPHPIPWTWVMANLSTAPLHNPPEVLSHQPSPQLHYYRSHSLLSPNGHYAAYSRIQLRSQVQFFQSQVSSVLFIENLKTGDLQAITPTSPLADNPFLESGDAEMGTISIVIPVAWSETGDRLLAREFESVFGTSLASDYAVLVERGHNRIVTIAPTQVQYTTAVLLGWSRHDPTCALFQISNMGDEVPQLMAVDLQGRTRPTPNDSPLTFGQTSSSVWTGPQTQS